jgi:DNA mismatch endonuclease (patch repair protein)
MDTFDKKKRTQIMKAVKSKNTKLEQKVFKELRRRGLRFRTNVSNLPGKPDIAIKKYKIVIFIDSCFWHGCPLHCRMPKTNIEYWQNKIKRNRERDKLITETYKKKNWHILRVWEHELKENFDKIIDKIEAFIRMHSHSRRKNAL